MERAKKRVFAGVAALALAGGAVTALGPSARAETPSCGFICVELYAQAFGTADITSTTTVTITAGKTNFIILSAPSLSAGTEDFVSFPPSPSTVAGECTAGVITSAAVCQTWPSDTVVQYEYSPFGVYSGMCIGIPSAAASGTKVSLQPCGTAQTLWVQLSIDTIGGYQPLIAATDANVNTPFVLTAGSAAGDKLTTHELSLVDGTFNPAQMWQTVQGSIS
jgi:hypothetical protein